MFRLLRTGLIVAAVAALSGTAAAQGWSFSYGVGDPYADPYYRPAYPAYPPPPVYYGPPPIIVAPAPAPSGRSVVVVSPGEVEDDLRANGFTRLSPVEAQGELYMLTANDPRGNLVDLTISMRTGQIVRARVLEARAAPELAPPHRPAQRAAPAKPAPKVVARPKATKPVPKPAPARAEPPARRAEPTPAPAAPADGEPDPLVVY